MQVKLFNQQPKEASAHTIKPYLIIKGAKGQQPAWDMERYGSSIYDTPLASLGE